MMAQHSLGDQLGWCITTQDYLNDLNQELKFVAQKYRNSVDNLRAFGYIEENMPHLENLCNEFEESIDKMVAYVENEHIEYVHGRSETIQEEISRKFGV